ncbi:nucleotide cyclase [Mycena vulgaris]|nr:nucleotide cyclase [Mycena vulgaris]
MADFRSLALTAPALGSIPACLSKVIPDRLPSGYRPVQTKFYKSPLPHSKLGQLSSDKLEYILHIGDLILGRLKDEVPPPVGHVAIVFTDIKGSTHLWEATPSGAIHLHNNLLRRHLRVCGGYEVRTEGDCFMCSFPTVLDAVWWCLKIQVELLNVSWPQDILECADGREVYDADGRLIYRGLSARGDPLRDATLPDGPRHESHGLLWADGDARGAHREHRRRGPDHAQHRRVERDEKCGDR